MLLLGYQHLHITTLHRESPTGYMTNSKNTFKGPFCERHLGWDTQGGLILLLSFLQLKNLRACPPA